MKEMRCIQNLSNLKGQILRVQWWANVIDSIESTILAVATTKRVRHMTVTNVFCVNQPLLIIISYVFFFNLFRIMRKPLQGIGRAMLFCMGFHWIKVKGQLSSPEEAPILAVAPHSSFIDAFALSVICISSPISRKENESIPLVGGLFVSH